MFANSPAQFSKGTAWPPNSLARVIALSGERLVTRMLRAPRESRARSVFSPVSPAPMIITSRSLSRLKIFSASSTATDPTDTLPRWMLVSVRMCLATLNARWKALLSRLPVWPL